MNKIMTPPIKTTTVEQIDKAAANYRAMLQKHATHFTASAVQQTLGSQEFAKQQYEVFRAHVEAVSSIVTRSASIDRTRTFMEALVATGRTQYLNENVVVTAPKGEGDAEFMFINLGRKVACDKLDEELANLGFELIVDPQGLAGINEADEAFADKYPNGTQWKDSSGNYCCAIFNRWNDERNMNVCRNDNRWYGHWWFPVRCK
jgi:hypothetical protein